MSFPSTYKNIDKYRTEDLTHQYLNCFYYPETFTSFNVLPDLSVIRIFAEEYFWGRE
jgi:hypothetical protein